MQSGYKGTYMNTRVRVEKVFRLLHIPPSRFSYAVQTWSSPCPYVQLCCNATHEPQGLDVVETN